MRNSIFTRPRRQIQASTAFASYRREVSDESQLQAAVTSLIALAGGDDDQFGIVGGEIVFIAPFVVTAPIIIPESLPGLLITSAGYVPIRPADDLDMMFDVRASRVSIIGVRAETNGDFAFETFVVVGDENASGLTVERNSVKCRRLFLDDHGATDVLIVHNRHVKATTSAGGPAVESAGARCKVIGNFLNTSGGHEAVVFDGGGEGTISMNHCDGGDIVTTASAGDNSVGLNTDTGTLTLHANDEETANTP